MRRGSLPAILLTLLTVAVLSLPSAGTPPGQGDPFSGDHCRRCHVGVSGTTVDATLTVTGGPERFEPDRSYLITVELDRGAGPQPHHQVLHGMHLEVTNGTLATSAPDLVSVGPREVATRGASERTSWSVAWTAPRGHEDVHFIAQAVMADGDGTEEGDVNLEARAMSFAPLDVPPQEAVGPWPDIPYLLFLVVAFSGLLGYLVVFTHRKPPPRRGWEP